MKPSLAQLEQDIEIDVRNHEGQTPLHRAAQEGNVEVICFLINLGSSIEAQDNDGWTALYHAAARGKVEVIQALIGARLLFWRHF